MADTPETAPEQEQNRAFFIAAVEVHYRRGEDVKQRKMNVLLESASAQLLKSDLAVLNQSALQRLNAESGIAPSDVLDTIIMHVSLMAITTPTLFHGTVANEEPTEQAPMPVTEPEGLN